MLTTEPLFFEAGFAAGAWHDAAMMQGRGGRVAQGRFGSQRSRSNWTQADDFAAGGGRARSRKGSGHGGRLSWSWKFVAPLWLGAAALGTGYGLGAFDSRGAGGAAALVGTDGSGGVLTSFSLCHSGGGYNCVVDGDTIWLEGTKVRIADIDAPETHEPRCASEKALGDKATLRLQQLLNGGAVTLQSIDRDEDRYGRKLRTVMVDGANVGDALIKAGLARAYAGGRRPWC